MFLASVYVSALRWEALFFPQDPMQEPTGHILLFVAFVSERQPQTRAFAFVANRLNVFNIEAVVAVETTQRH